MSEEVKFMSKDMAKQILMVKAEGDFIWHPDADDYIENGDACDSFKHILRALRKITKPITDEQIEEELELQKYGDMPEYVNGFLSGISFAEQHHGISGGE